MAKLSFKTSSDDYILYVGLFDDHYYGFSSTNVFDSSGTQSISLDQKGYFVVSICKYTDSEGNIKYYLNTPMIIHDTSIFNGTPIDVTFAQTDDTTPVMLDEMPTSVSLNWIYDITDSIKLPTISDDGTYKCNIYKGYIFGGKLQGDSSDHLDPEYICVPDYILTDLRKAYGAHYKYRRTISYFVVVILSIIIIVLVLLLTGYYGMRYIKHHHHK